MGEAFRRHSKGTGGSGKHTSKRPKGQDLKAEACFRDLVKGVLDYAIFLLDREGRITFWNAGAERLTGYAESEILGEPIARLFSPEEQMAGKPRENLLKAADSGRLEDEAWRVRKDGRLILVNRILTAVRAPTGELRGFVKIMREAGEERTGLALLQRQKLEALGVLAGGIAHDFNNLLGAGRGLVELALTSSDLPEAVPYLENLQGLMEKGADLIGQMLDYAGRSKGRLVRVDLNRLLQEMARLLEMSIARMAVIHWNLQPGPLLIEGNPSQLQQVVMNLVHNASEALGGRNGTISLGTRRVEREEDEPERGCGWPALPGGSYVVLEVADGGAGMTPDVLSRIFEPFFTTKAEGRGLGLAALHAIVRSHHGTIRVHSEPGRGSTFTLHFPAAPGGAGPVPDPPAACG